jgi:1-acyl-sn-glycerol-3-phosphate acyltransferase
MRLKKAIARFFLWIMGWTIDDTVPEEVHHSVMVAAPHTSNWDFLFAIFGFWIMGIEVRYFIKDTYTRSLFGWFFRWTGAIGVDRTKRSNGLVDYAIELLKSHEKLVILVPAEGTRKRVERWKLGFYHIAREAGVPISLGYLDYPNKRGGVLKVFQPSGVLEQDMQFIQDTYLTVTGKYPENYNPQIY